MDPPQKLVLAPGATIWDNAVGICRANRCLVWLVFVTPWMETSVAIQGLCFGMKI